MEDVILKLAELYKMSGEDWYKIKEEMLDVMDHMLKELGTRFNDKEIYFMRDGELINAIKALRERTGLGLREAKIMCQNYMARFGLVNKHSGKVPEAHTNY